MHFESGKKQMLRVEAIQKLFQPIEQQELELVAGDSYIHALQRLPRVQVFPARIEQSDRGLREKRVQFRSANAKPQVGRVFKEFVHGPDATARTQAAIAETLHSRERFEELMKLTTASPPSPMQGRRRTRSSL